MSRGRNIIFGPDVPATMSIQPGRGGDVLKKKVVVVAISVMVPLVIVPITAKAAGDRPVNPRGVGPRGVVDIHMLPETMPIVDAAGRIVGVVLLEHSPQPLHADQPSSMIRVNHRNIKVESDGSIVETVTPARPTPHGGS